MALVSSELGILNEKVSHGNTFDFSWSALPKSLKDVIIADAKKHDISEDDIIEYMNSTDTKTEGGADVSLNRLATAEKNQFDAIVARNLEEYDKSLDEAVLLSENVVYAYNELIAGHWKKCVEAMEHYEDHKKEAMDKGRLFSKAISLQSLAMPIQMISTLQQLIVTLTEEYSDKADAEITKLVIDTLYKPSDDPKEIRDIVKARIQFANAQTALLKNLLEVNYRALGITKTDALMYSQQISSDNKSERKQSIRAVKELVANKLEDCKISGGYDGRKLGLGVILFADGDDNGFKQNYKENLDTVVQYLINYDCVIVGHGDSSESEEIEKLKEKRDAEVNKLSQERYQKEYERRDKIISQIKERAKADGNSEIGKLMVRIEQLKSHRNKYRELQRRVYDIPDNLDIEEFDKRLKEADELAKECEEKLNILDSVISDAIDQLMELEFNNTTDDKYIRAINKVRDRLYVRLEEPVKETEEIKKLQKSINELREKDSTKRWTIQEITTPSGAKFTDVNDLLHHLISKEHMKKFMLLACNPGHHELAKDIRDSKEIEVRHAKNSIIAENVTTTYIDQYDEILNTLDETSYNLEVFCENYGIDYNNNTYLNECISWVETGIEVESLNEASAKEIWIKVKEFIKKCIGFIVGIIKKFIAMIKTVINKIKEFFHKIFGTKTIEPKFRKNIKTFVILTENATVKKLNISSWKEFESHMLNACQGISRRINKLEQDQTRSLSEVDRFAEQKERTIHESIHGITDSELNDLIALL